MPFSGPDVPEKPEVAPDANASGSIAAHRDRLARSSRSPSRLNAMHPTTATLAIARVNNTQRMRINLCYDLGALLGFGFYFSSEAHTVPKRPAGPACVRIAATTACETELSIKHLCYSQCTSNGQVIAKILHLGYVVGQSAVLRFAQSK